MSGSPNSSVSGRASRNVLVAAACRCATANLPTLVTGQVDWAQVLATGLVTSALRSEHLPVESDYTKLQCCWRSWPWLLECAVGNAAAVWAVKPLGYRLLVVLNAWSVRMPSTVPDYRPPPDRVAISLIHLSGLGAITLCRASDYLAVGACSVVLLPRGPGYVISRSHGGLSGPTSSWPIIRRLVRRAWFQS
jgi:hypothetical protein